MASPISAFGKRLLLGLRIPAAAPHVDMAVGPEGYVFVFQQDFLFGPGGNRPSLTVHHPVARQAGRCRSPMQRLSYHRASTAACQPARRSARRLRRGRADSPHDVVYFSVKLFAIHRFRRPVRFVCRRNPLSLCIGARFSRCGYGVRSRPVHDDPHSSSGLRGCGGPFRKISVLYRRSVARQAPEYPVSLAWPGRTLQAVSSDAGGLLLPGGLFEIFPQVILRRYRRRDEDRTAADRMDELDRVGHAARCLPPLILERGVLRTSDRRGSGILIFEQIGARIWWCLPASSSIPSSRRERSLSASSR